MRLNQYSPHDLSTQGAKIDPVVTKKSSIFQNKNHFFDRQKRINWIVPPQPVIDREQVRVYPRQNITQCGKPTSIWPYGHIRSLLSKNMMKTSICRHQKIVSSGLPKSLSNFMPINKPPLQPHAFGVIRIAPIRSHLAHLAGALRSSLRRLGAIGAHDTGERRDSAPRVLHNVAQDVAQRQFHEMFVSEKQS